MDKLIYMAIGAGLYHYYRKYKDSQIETIPVVVPVVEPSTNGLSEIEGAQSLLLSNEQAVMFEKMCEQYRSNPNCVCRFYWDKYRNQYKIMELCPNFEYFYDRPSA
ncbi:MAG: hypothetical protein WC428_05330 [Candidatus Paceibacterota bacterium]|jgi:hypothetical protein